MDWRIVSDSQQGTRIKLGPVEFGIDEDLFAVWLRMGQHLSQEVAALREENTRLRALAEARPAEPPVALAGQCAYCGRPLKPGRRFCSPACSNRFRGTSGPRLGMLKRVLMPDIAPDGEAYDSGTIVQIEPQGEVLIQGSYGLWKGELTAEGVVRAKERLERAPHHLVSGAAPSADALPHG